MNKFYWLVDKDVVDYLPDIFHCELENLHIWKNVVETYGKIYISYNEETNYYGWMPPEEYVKQYHINSEFVYCGVLDMKYLRRKKLERIKIL